LINLSFDKLTSKLRNNVAQQKAQLAKRKDELEATIHKKVGELLG